MFSLSVIFNNIITISKPFEVNFYLQNLGNPNKTWPALCISFMLTAGVVTLIVWKSNHFNQTTSQMFNWYFTAYTCCWTAILTIANLTYRRGGIHTKTEFGIISMFSLSSEFYQYKTKLYSGWTLCKKNHIAIILIDIAICMQLFFFPFHFHWKIWKCDFCCRGVPNKHVS